MNFQLPTVKLTAQQALMEICMLLSDSEGDMRRQIRMILDSVADEEKAELRKHPLYRNLKMKV
jgi:hypothetical protein